MPSGYTTTLPTDVLLDSGVVYVGTQIWGATVGGVRFSPVREVREIEFDGKRSPVAGLDRVVKYGARFSAVFLEMGPLQIPYFEDGIAPTGGPLPTPVVYTPRKAGALLAGSVYLQDVAVVFQRGGGGAARIHFRRARVTTYTIEGHENAEGLVNIEIDAQVSIGLAGADTDDAPYRIQLSTTGAFPSDSTLFRYVPGDSLPGQTFTRASTATYWDASGVMQTATSGTLRDAHYIGGVRHTLIEPARTQQCVYSTPNLASPWTLSNVTRTSGVADAAGGTTANTFLESTDGGNTQHQVQPSCPSGISGYTASCLVKRTNNDWMFIRTETVTGGLQYTYFDLTNLVVGSTQHAAAGIFAMGNGWILCWVNESRVTTGNPFMIGIANANNGFNYIGTGTKSLTIHYAQIEGGFGPTSYIAATGGSNVSRVVDVLKWTWTAIVQSQTMYADTTKLHLGGAIASIADQADGVPNWQIDDFGTGGVNETWNAAGSNTTLLNTTVVPYYGRLEIRDVLNADGSLQNGVSSNGAAEVLTTGAGAALPGTWGTSPFIQANSGAFRKLAVNQGDADRTTMRAA